MDNLRIGMTYYRVFPLFSDAAKTVPLSLSGKTPRASLMMLDGTPLATFGCSVVGDVADGNVAVVLPRDDAALLKAGLRLANLDLDDADGVTTDEAHAWQINVIPGQKP